MNQTEMLKRLEWSATAHGMYGTARRCPECSEVHPDESLNHGGAIYERGKGHTETCELNRLINQPQIDVERLIKGEAVARAVWDWLLHAESIDLVPWCDDKIKIAKMEERKHVLSELRETIESRSRELSGQPSVLPKEKP